MLYFYEDIKEKNFFLVTQHFDWCVFKPTVWQYGSLRQMNREGYEKLLFHDHYVSCTQGSPVEIQTSTQWNLIGRSMTAPPPELSPSSILPLPSSLGTFITARKNSVCAPKTILFQFYILYKFRKSDTA